MDERDDRVDLPVTPKDVIKFMDHLLRMNKLTQDEYDRMLKNIHKVF